MAGGRQRGHQGRWVIEEVRVQAQELFHPYRLHGQRASSLRKDKAV